jgi:hypothetical protein
MMPSSSRRQRREDEGITNTKHREGHKMKFTTAELGMILLSGLILIMVGTFLVFGAVGCGIEAILFGIMIVATSISLHREQD